MAPDPPEWIVFLHETLRIRIMNCVPVVAPRA
jgi:hypothetical protein